MFEYSPEKLNKIASKIKKMVHNEFNGDQFAMNAVLGRLLGPYRTNIGWALDHFYGEKASLLIGNLVKLHDALVANNRTVENKYEIGSCDRYAAYIPHHVNKVLVFCNQNVSYIVVLEPKRVWLGGTYEPVDTYGMHIRIMTGSRYSLDPIACDFNCDYGKILAGELGENGASDYFRYLDGRDRGYIMSLTPSITSDYGKVFYTTKDMGQCNPNADYVIEELQAYCSRIKSIIEEMNDE